MSDAIASHHTDQYVRATIGSRAFPPIRRVHETRRSGHARRTKGSSAMYSRAVVTPWKARPPTRSRARRTPLRTSTCVSGKKTVDQPQANTNTPTRFAPLDHPFRRADSFVREEERRTRGRGRGDWGNRSARTGECAAVPVERSTGRSHAPRRGGPYEHRAPPGGYRSVEPDVRGDPAVAGRNSGGRCDSDTREARELGRDRALVAPGVIAEGTAR